MKIIGTKILPTALILCCQFNDGAYALGTRWVAESVNPHEKLRGLICLVSFTSLELTEYLKTEPGFLSQDFLFLSISTYE